MPIIARRIGNTPQKGGRGIAADAPVAKANRKLGAKPTNAKGSGELARRIALTRIEAVISAAERSGLLREKSGRIGGRVSPKLVKKAKDITGIKTDTDLIEFALANVALEDRFVEAFKAVRGTVDPELDLGF